MHRYDGRVRTSINMFGTVTGRACRPRLNILLVQVSGPGIFIKPSYGSCLVYIGYTSQEPGVMGYIQR